MRWYSWSFQNDAIALQLGMAELVGPLRLSENVAISCSLWREGRREGDGKQGHRNEVAKSTM